MRHLVAMVLAVGVAATAFVALTAAHQKEYPKASYRMLWVVVLLLTYYGELIRP